ncbi:MAG: LysM peptidoglycan-binding domain-containing protein [Verrucomicrobia bacterium]|nr:MAG: LysM peptidoglycan-binding domain-containing protein [Verrucomicrobiota bacterium]
MRPIALLGLAGLLVAAPLVAAEIDSEDFNQLKARVAAQDEGIESFRGTLQQLRQEVARLRSDNDALRTQLSGTKNLATQEQFAKLADQVREVEKNRTKDKEQILEAIEKLKTLPPVVIPEPPKPAPKPADKGADKPAGKTADKPAGKTGEKPAADPGAKADKPADAGPELPTEYYEHKVDEGETLGAIIEAYNKQHGLKVKLAHVVKANPSLKDPKKLRVGQTIRIPAVK